MPEAIHPFCSEVYLKIFKSQTATKPILGLVYVLDTKSRCHWRQDGTLEARSAGAMDWDEAMGKSEARPSDDSEPVHSRKIRDLSNLAPCHGRAAQRRLTPWAGGGGSPAERTAVPTAGKALEICS